MNNGSKVGAVAMSPFSISPSPNSVLWASRPLHKLSCSAGTRPPLSLSPRLHAHGAVSHLVGINSMFTAPARNLTHRIESEPLALAIVMKRATGMASRAATAMKYIRKVPGYSLQVASLASHSTGDCLMIYFVIARGF